MLRLILALLLLFPAAVFGQTVTLPAETVATGKLVLVQPVFSPADKLQDVRYMVLGLKAAPRYHSLPSIKDVLVVERPGEGDEVTVIVAATFEGGKLANLAFTNIKGSGTPGTTPPPTTPTTPPTNIPATGLAVIMVVDASNVPADINQLAKGANAITQHLAQRQGAWYVRNSTDSLIAPLKTSIEGKQLPVLIVINSATKQVVLAESFTPTGDATRTANAILQRIK